MSRLTRTVLLALGGSSGRRCVLRPGLLRADSADLVTEPRELMGETEFPA